MVSHSLSKFETNLNDRMVNLLVAQIYMTLTWKMKKVIYEVESASVLAYLKSTPQSKKALVQ